MVYEILIEKSQKRLPDLLAKLAIQIHISANKNSNMEKVTGPTKTYNFIKLVFDNIIQYFERLQRLPMIISSENHFLHFPCFR